LNKDAKQVNFMLQ